MPTYAQALIDIESELRSNWSELDIVSQNQDYNPDNSVGFCYMEILTGTADYASMGSPRSNKHRQIGVLLCHIFVPKNTGDGLAITYCSQIADIFRGKIINDIHFSASSIGGGETADDYGNFWRRTVSIEFRFDELG